MKTLILGGTGFVGRNVIQCLREAGIDCASSSRAEGADLRDPAAARELFKAIRPEIVVNCAAHVGSLNYVTQQAGEVIADNSRIILGLYEALTAVSSGALVINPIANCAYPATTNTFEEDHLWDGPLHRSVLAYGSTRRMLLSVAECFQMQHGVRSAHLLVPNMYGPYDSTDPNKAHALNALIGKFVKATLSGVDHVDIWGSGAAIREWLYAADFARIVQHLVENPGMMGLSEPLNIGQNFGLSVRELVDLIVASTGFKGRVTYDYNMPDGAPRKVMGDRRFRKVFPEFVFTPLQEGIDTTIDYYRSLPAC